MKCATAALTMHALATGSRKLRIRQTGANLSGIPANSLCTTSDAKGSEIARLLLPDHSEFSSTSPGDLLGVLGGGLSGFAGDICVLYTSDAAYVREFEIITAGDSIASEPQAANRAAMDHMSDRLKSGVHLSSHSSVTRPPLKNAKPALFVNC
ncbi:MAG: hypothetical protein EOP84_31400 [Verrucomicrobiaceae bacterium]|nr:MAG: hypothetical protein EOP84_31400 [Verrucomicrobiaceae bacterium]